ncbi:MAG: RNase H family protein [Polyangiaceae bacterium]
MIQTALVTMGAVSGSRDYLCYTDGSCKSGNGAPGGWGFYIKPPSGDAIEGRGHAVSTLAKIMEYRAVAEALAMLPEGVRAVVFSDNESLVQNLTRQLENWRVSNFVNVDPDVASSARSIDASITEKKLVVRFQWVRSHNGNAGNERADELATGAAREAKATLKRSDIKPR